MITSFRMDTIISKINFYATVFDLFSLIVVNDDLSANYFDMFSEHEHCEESIRWLVKRGIRLKSLKVRYREEETERVNVSTILDLDISSLRYINLKGTSIGDEGVLLIADGCPELAEISLSCCYKLKDASIIALGKSCHQLISIDLHVMEKFEDFVILFILSLSNVICDDYLF